MIAYFALLSFVPLLFLALALLGLFGRADESSYLVTELKRALPGSSVSSIVAPRFANSSSTRTWAFCPSTTTSTRWYVTAQSPRTRLSGRMGTRSKRC